MGEATTARYASATCPHLLAGWPQDGRSRTKLPRWAVCRQGHDGIPFAPPGCPRAGFVLHAGAQAHAEAGPRLRLRWAGRLCPEAPTRMPRLAPSEDTVTEDAEFDSPCALAALPMLRLPRVLRPGAARMLRALWLFAGDPVSPRPLPNSDANQYTCSPPNTDATRLERAAIPMGPTSAVLVKSPSPSQS
eukprot:6903440-Prymnesium_polylepis.2